MLGRGLYSKKDRVLPGIYVRGNFTQSQTIEKIRIFTIKSGSNITLKLTYPFIFRCTNDGEGNVTLSSTYGFSLLTNNDGEGNVSMEVKSKW